MGEPNYMDRDEMLARLEEGRESPAEISLDKWRRLLPPKIMTWKWFCDHAGGILCAMCEAYGGDCDLCELDDGMGECCEPWNMAQSAAKKNDRPAFLAARERLLKRLRRIVAKEREED